MEVHYSHGDVRDEVEHWLGGISIPVKHDSESGSGTCPHIAVRPQAADSDLGDKMFIALHSALSDQSVDKVGFNQMHCRISLSIGARLSIGIRLSVVNNKITRSSAAALPWQGSDPHLQPSLI